MLISPKTLFIEVLHIYALYYTSCTFLPHMVDISEEIKPELV